MSRTERSARRGNAGPNDWFDGFDPTRDGVEMLGSHDRVEMHKIDRAVKRNTKTVLTAIRHGKISADDAVYPEPHKQTKIYIRE